jgi:hypothetical protein
MLLTERMGEVEGIREGEVSTSRRTWAERLASFACGLAVFSLLPLIGLARDDLQVSLPAMAGAIVAGLMLGVGMRLHLRFVGERIGIDRLRWMMLVMLAWATASMGAANWSHQFLLVQLLISVIAGATLSLGLPGLPALYGAAVVAVVAPLLCRLILRMDLAIEGAWPLLTGATGVVVLALAGVSHGLVRPAYVVDAAGDSAAKGEATSEGFDQGEIPAAAAAA